MLKQIFGVECRNAVSAMLEGSKELDETSKVSHMINARATFYQQCLKTMARKCCLKFGSMECSDEFLWTICPGVLVTSLFYSHSALFNRRSWKIISRPLQWQLMHC